MMRAIDNFLNRITMYRLTLYGLIGIVTTAAIFGLLGWLPYHGLTIVLSALWLVGVCWLTNWSLAKIWRAPVHHDSAYISGLILTLIIVPYRSADDSGLFILAPVIAMASKYILAYHRQHVFNPAAYGVMLTALTIQKSASWWVGTDVMLPVVAIVGFLIVRKIRRWNVVFVFLATAFMVTMSYGLNRHVDILTVLIRTLTASPLIFFATVMLVEPQTMPPTRRWRLLYALFVGFLFLPSLHIGTWYTLPEMALLVGNLTFFLIARRHRYTFRLRQKLQPVPSVYELVFDGPPNLRFRPGQYFEWTLPHLHPDNRGQRRYFTIASSPTESNVRLGVKSYQPASTFKQRLVSLEPGETIVAGQLDGDFTLPSTTKEKLVFMAGGIGITPFRSMIQYVLHRHEQRDIILFYANQTASEIVYQDILVQAAASFGLKSVHVLSDVPKISPDWAGERGYITADMIKRHVPDYANRTFYLSGPQGMVTAYRQILREIGIRRSRVKTDYFPGFA